MTRYADPERCPGCRAAMPYGASRCPSCGLNLEGPLAARLFATLSSADDLLAQMRAPAAATASGAAPAGPVGPPGATATTPSAAGVGTLVRPETAPAVGVPAGGGPLPPEHHGGLSGASVPKILLGLGALCLLVAALAPDPPADHRGLRRLGTQCTRRQG